MATEIEMKIPVEEIETVEGRLRALAARAIGQFAQDDLFFDTPDRQLLAEDRGLRLRTAERVDVIPKQRRCVLTYKGARQAGQIKRREEIEVEVGDPATMGEVLERIGYQPMMQVRKNRGRYQLGECYVELDTLPLLGCFVEIEGPGEEAILRAARDLGLDPGKGITDSYASLLLAEARRLGLPMREGRFLLPE